MPGRGCQLEPERMLSEMQQVGLAATELGPDGFLPGSPARLAAVLDAHHLQAVGGFTPFVLHDPDVDPLVELHRLPGFLDERGVRAGAAGRRVTVRRRNRASRP